MLNPYSDHPQPDARGVSRAALVGAAAAFRISAFAYYSIASVTRAANTRRRARVPQRVLRRTVDNTRLGVAHFKRRQRRRGAPGKRSTRATPGGVFGDDAAHSRRRIFFSSTRNFTRTCHRRHRHSPPGGRDDVPILRPHPFCRSVGISAAAVMVPSAAHENDYSDARVLTAMPRRFSFARTLCTTIACLRLFLPVGITWIISGYVRTVVQPRAF